MTAMETLVQMYEAILKPRLAYVALIWGKVISQETVEVTLAKM